MGVSSKKHGLRNVLAQPMVWHGGVLRKAKGFSLSEIEKSEAFPGGVVAWVAVDKRRKTCLAENVATLKSTMGHGTAQKTKGLK